MICDNKILLLLLCCVPCLFILMNDREVSIQFLNFIDKYGKTYKENNTEFMRRLEYFKV